MTAVHDLLLTAIRHHRAGRLTDARRVYGDVLAAQPGQVDASHLLGVLAAQRGRYREAELLIGQAVAAAPQRGDLHASLGNVFYAQNRIEEGSACYKRALFHTFLKTVPISLEEILHFAERPPVLYPGRNEDLARYRSQMLQDQYLDRWVFRGLEHGTFIDVGAHDGISLSNTWFFEKARGWNGVCIEPNPVVFPRLAATRDCRTLNCGVGERTGSAEFLKISGYSEMLSGFLHAYDADHRTRIDNELRAYGGSSETITVETRTLNDIAGECGIAETAYVSMDTEGGETGILTATDFSKLFVHAASVECAPANVAAMTAMMHEKGFDMIKSLGVDLMFLNRASRFYPAYDALRRG